MPEAQPFLSTGTRPRTRNSTTCTPASMGRTCVLLSGPETTNWSVCVRCPTKIFPPSSKNRRRTDTCRTPSATPTRGGAERLSRRGIGEKRVLIITAAATTVIDVTDARGVGRRRASAASRRGTDATTIESTGDNDIKLLRPLFTNFCNNLEPML